MSDPITLEQLKNASLDAQALAEFMQADSTKIVHRRIASSIRPLQYHLEYLESIRNGAITDSLITANSQLYGAVPRTQAQKNKSWLTAEDFGASDNTLNALLNLDRQIAIGTKIKTDDAGIVEIAPSGASDHDAVTAGGTKLYVLRDSSSFSSRSDFVQAVSEGFVVPEGAVVVAGNVAYACKKGASDILDLPNYVPFGQPEFEHHGGHAVRYEPTRAVISHHRNSANEIVDVVRIINPKPNTFKMVTHPSMNKTGGTSPRASLRELSAIHKVNAMINSFYFVNDNGIGFDGEIIRPNGVLISEGVAISGWDAATGANRTHAIICTKDGILRKRDRGDGGDASDYVSEGAIWGYSAGAWCVLNGSAVAVPSTIMSDGQRSARTIVGQAENGDYITISAQGKSGESGLTIGECAAVALKYGCVSAFISDGGGSTQVWWGNFYALPSSDAEFSKERTVCGGLAIDCDISNYDSGWISQELSSSFTARNGIGLRIRQINSVVHAEFDLTGPFTVAPQNILAGYRDFRYTTTHMATGRGVLIGSGGILGTWNFGAGVSVQKVSESQNPVYLAGTAQWTVKHAVSN